MKVCGRDGKGISGHPVVLNKDKLVFTCLLDYKDKGVTEEGRIKSETLRE